MTTEQSTQKDRPQCDAHAAAISSVMFASEDRAREGEPLVLAGDSP